MNRHSDTLHPPLPSTPPSGRFGVVLENLAARMGGSATAHSVYGDPVKQDGVTVIPVARVRYGLGGGGGKKEDEADRAGGGVQVSPAGYIEMKEGTSVFHAIRAPLTFVPLIMSVGVAGFLLMHGLRRLLRP